MGGVLQATWVVGWGEEDMGGVLQATWGAGVGVGVLQATWHDREV